MSVNRDLYIMYASLHVQLVIFRWFGGVRQAQNQPHVAFHHSRSPFPLPLFHSLSSLSPLRSHRHLNWVVVTYSTRPACCQCPPRIRITLCPSLLSVRLSLFLFLCPSLCLLPVSCIFRFLGLFLGVVCCAALQCILCAHLLQEQQRGATATSTATLAAQHMRVCTRVVLHLFAVNFESGRQHSGRV